MQFKFRLQKVLDIAVDKEKNEQIEFTKAQNSYNEQQQIVDDIKHQIEIYSNPKYHKTAAELRYAYRYISVLQLKSIEEEKKLVEVKCVLDYRRKELNKAHIEKRKIEILKEKRQEEFKVEEKFLEDKHNNEMAQQMWQRTRNQS